jgi:hypothetical protein
MEGWNNGILEYWGIFGKIRYHLRYSLIHHSIIPILSDLLPFLCAPVILSPPYGENHALYLLWENTSILKRAQGINGGGRH